MKDKDQESYIFDFEKLEVYQRGLRFVVEVINIVKNLPPYLRYTIGGNFIRAAMSFINNIAEGSGKSSKKDKSRFYGYSLTSIGECIPSITVLFREKYINESKKNDLREECIQLGRMTVGLIRKI